MHVGTPSTTSEYTLYGSSVRQCVLSAEADCEKDLGVWISWDTTHHREPVGRGPIQN